MNIMLVKTENGFFPAYDSDKEKADKIGIGELREFSTEKNRNLKHHRKFWALMRLTLHILPEPKRKEAFDFGFDFQEVGDVLVYVKLKLGYVTRMVLKNGVIVNVPKSISFKNMGQDKFEDFYSRSLDAIIFLTGADRELLENELAGFM